MVIRVNSAGFRFPRTLATGRYSKRAGKITTPLPLIRKDPEAIIEQLGLEQGERLIRLVGDSASYVFSLIKRYGIACDAEQNGWIQAAHSQQQLAISTDRFKQWQAYAADMEMLDREAVAKLMGSESYVGGLLVKSGGHINPLAFARGMAQVAIDKGVNFLLIHPRWLCNKLISAGKSQRQREQ